MPTLTHNEKQMAKTIALKFASKIEAKNEIVKWYKKTVADYRNLMAKGVLEFSQYKEIGDQAAEWFNNRFRVETSSTPRGGKKAKEAASRFLWSVRHAVYRYQDFSSVQELEQFLEQSLKDYRLHWEKFENSLDEFVEKYASRSTAQVPLEVKTSRATYVNKKGMSAKTLDKFVKKIDQVLGSLKGWRAKALKGKVVVVLAGPKDFRGTAGGFYRTSEDSMYVRATPDVLKRSSGYGSAEYILIHEMGHRYEAKNPTGNFDDWYTTRYSFKDGEAFAELFALGHFGIRSLRGTEFGDLIDKFESQMG